MDDVELKMDSKGRICLPPDIREEMGETVIATKTPKGILLRAGRRGVSSRSLTRSSPLSLSGLGSPRTGPQRR